MADLSEKNMHLERKETPSPKQEQKGESLSVKLDVSEVREGVENADVMTTGEVQETNGEDKKSIGSSMQSSGSQSSTAVAAKPLKIPSVEVMRKQISKEIEREIQVLERQAKHMMRNPSQFSAFTMNGMVSKIRELKDILSQLAYATVENLKGWWMKYVKGNTI